jgi:hypothetical protein
MAVKFNQYWDLLPGKQAEYADFIREDFFPTLKNLGVQVVAGWYMLVGKGPHIVIEGTTQDVYAIDKIVTSTAFKAMHTRLSNMVQNYMSRIMVPTGRVPKEHGQMPPPKIVKFNQSWSINPGCEEQYSRFIREKHIPVMESLGITIAAGWQVLIGAGPNILSEGHVQDLETIGRALSDERYRLLITALEALVNSYESRILVRHRLIWEAIERVYGGTIRYISDEEIRSMYGPMVG